MKNTEKTTRTDKVAPLAFVVLAHKNPEQVVRLVRRLEGPDSLFVIHYDRGSPDSEYRTLTESLGGMPNVHFAPRRRPRWGHISIVRTNLECMDFLLRVRAPFSHAVLLSGQITRW